MWLLHQGTYSNGAHPYGRGGYIGFAEGAQSTVDVGKVCYCYKDDWNSSSKRHDSLWVIVDHSTPYLEIGYAEFDLNGEKFYFDCGPDKFHVGDKGSYLFRTKYVITAGGEQTEVDTYFIFEEHHGTVTVFGQEDGSVLGPGGWMLSANETMPDIPTDFSPAGADQQDYEVSFNAAGSYASDPALSGLHPKLKFHYDFRYKLPNTSYNDDFPSEYGKHGTGKYARCFTSAATDQIGDYILSGAVTSGEILSNDFYMWKGALKDEHGKAQYHVGRYLFPEYNPNRKPYTTYPLHFYEEDNAYVYKTASNGTYIKFQTSGDDANSGTLTEFLDGQLIRTIAVGSLNRVGTPTNYRDFDYLYHHLDDDKKIFLAGDQLVINR